MQFFLPPVVDGGKGDPSTMLIGVEPWMIPNDAKNPEAGIELFRYMTSLPKAKEFVETKNTLMAIKGSDEVKLPEVLVPQSAALKAAKTVWSNQFRSWYKAAEKDIEGALTSMLNGELTPQQFVDRCEAAAEKTRKDSSIPKYKVS
jgi:N-acetylglucosamine transport system substrate-binding protein